MQLAVAGRVITGLGTGLSFPTILKMIALYSPPKKVGAHQAFFAGFFSMGCIVAYLLIPCLTPCGWRWAYLVPGLGYLPLLAFSLFLDVEHRPPARASAAALANLGAVAFTFMFGWLKDHQGSFSTGFVVLSIICVLSLLLGSRTLGDHSRSGSPRA